MNSTGNREDLPNFCMMGIASANPLYECDGVLRASNAAKVDEMQ